MMKPFKDTILSFISNRLDTKRLICHTGTSLILPFYHTVSDEYLPHIHPLYRPKTIKEFENDLDFLLKHFQPVDMQTVFACCRERKSIQTPSFHLSFDDGLKEVYDIITPLLYSKGIPFSVFVNSDFVDNKTLFSRHREALESQDIDPETFLNEKSPYLSTAQLKEMQKMGVHIGAHSINHPRYDLIPEEEQVMQTLESCKFVKDTFTQGLTTFAFPFSDTGISNHFFDRIYSAIDLSFGISGIYFRHNNRHIGRIDMEKYGHNARECINKAILVKKIKDKWN
ncbi:MAG: polysaccharide deacetylase family protein [Dysgonamonadaceae bacterium]|jgi:peptidoglycan/xylan/chitin deacetylase (PgdA/CDA1 family)|nr:polysaccharide deacetylase family protein [Dysgonamonadaceae bacterium]